MQKRTKANAAMALQRLFGSRRARSALVAAALSAAVVPVQTAASSVEGSWVCEYGAYDTSLQQRPAIYMQFDLALYGGGQAQVQGVVASSVGSYPMAVNGSWTVFGSDLVVVGQMSSYFGPMPFEFGARVVNDSYMHSSYNAPDGNIITSSCRRLG